MEAPDVKSSSALSQKISSHSLWWNLRGIGFFVGFLVLLFCYVFFDVFSGWSVVVATVGLFVGLLVWPYRWQRRRMRIVQKNREQVASSILAEVIDDSVSSEYVLFLRPFITTSALGIGLQLQRTGQINTGRVRSADRQNLPAELSHGDLETLLADVFWPPPFIGLGQPGEHFGVARLPSDEQEWQSLVSKLMDQAAAIIVVPSHRPGTRWELEQLVDRRLLRKCLFFVEPPLGEAAMKDWQATRQLVMDLGLFFPTFAQWPANRRYVGSFVKCFADQSACVAIDIDYQLKVLGSRTKLSGQMLRSLCAEATHADLSAQLGRAVAEDRLVYAAGGTNLALRIFRAN